MVINIAALTAEPIAAAALVRGRTAALAVPQVTAFKTTLWSY